MPLLSCPPHERDRVRRRAALVGLAACLVLLLCAPPLHSQIERAADAPEPLAPEESLERFELREGFRIELVASEPLIADPTAVAWDERGRLFVSELHGYNLEGHLDVQELNKTGVLDRKVRRIPARREARAAAAKETYGTVKLLEDADGDGRVDRAAVWADRLPPCYGIIPARGGIIVLCAPHILYLADRDEDGVAEIRRTLFTGFGVGALERGINNPRHGVDNWVYAAAGRGGRLTGPRLDAPVELGNTDFRFRADGSAIEPVTGANGTFGLAMTDFGDRFVLSTSHHARYAVPLPHRYLTRNPHVPSPETMADAADYTRIYPTSPPHPWRLARSRDPDWVRFYGVRETTPSGLFTSACGQMIYRAGAFPAAFRGNHFSCDPQNNLIHRCVVERQGAGFRVHRAPGEEEREFLTSSEKWFRPNNLATGPDGAIYVVDMYREIIEDYSAIPRFLQQQYGLIEGNDRGRIWRISYEDARRAEPPDLSAAPSEELARLLGHANAWWRETAQRLLVERHDLSVVDSLVREVREGDTAPGRLHALYTLEGLGALEPSEVETALEDPVCGLRVHALRLADRFLDRAPRLFERVLAMTGDEDPEVRLQLALTLGESGDRRALAALVELALEHGSERWMPAAIASSASETAADLLETIVAEATSDRPLDLGGAASVLGLLSATVGSRREGEEIGRALRVIASIDDTPGAQAQALASLAGGLRRESAEGRELELGDDGEASLLGLVASSRRDVREAAFEVVGALGTGDSPVLEAAFARFAAEVRDPSLAPDRRVAAMELLASAPLGEVLPVARELLEPEHSVELQLAAVSALSPRKGARIATALLAGWEGFTPAVRRKVADALFARADRLPAVLDALEDGKVEPAAIDRFHRLRLTESDDAGIRERARALLLEESDDEEREALFRRYAGALAGDRDPARGEELFRTHCLSCHEVRGEGHAVGPDLASERERADETLLEEVLEPSRRITAGYAAYVATTRDGRVVSGVLASESATSITLRGAEGEESTVLRKNLDSLSASPVSLMPDNLASLLTPRDVADIIGYLRSAFGERLPASLVLFDEEEDFPSFLKQGGGTARLMSGSAYSGGLALSVSPLQRYSDRIPGWRYRIVERPEPGEFRYLRLAWRSRDGEGVMVELAAGGRWPDAEEPERRYYAGENTTEWAARQVSSLPPREWTVVTFDLWRDNGSFRLTGIAPTAMGGMAEFDRIELLRSLAEAGVSGK